MREAIIIFLMLVGSFFVFVAALGALRMPDVFSRMSATTKAATLGVGTILMAVTFYFNEQGVTSRAIATVVFIFITAPVSAHMIGRAAYNSRATLWSGTVVDELEGRFNPETQVLASKATVEVEGEAPDGLEEMHRVQYDSPSEPQFAEDADYEED